MYVIGRYVGYSSGAVDAYTEGYESSSFDAVAWCCGKQMTVVQCSQIKDPALTHNSKANYDFRHYLHVVRIPFNLLGFWEIIIMSECCSLQQGVEGNPLEMKPYPNHKHHKINRG